VLISSLFLLNRLLTYYPDIFYLFRINVFPLLHFTILLIVSRFVMAKLWIK
jgi:hypothetical protein